MNNNRKQKITSMLDSLTKKELDDYLSTKNYINLQAKEFLERFDKIKSNREDNHHNTISNKISDNFQKGFGQIYKIGQAYVIAFVIECFYDKKYKIKDLKEYLKAMIETDKELKEYVYEIMKDY